MKTRILLILTGLLIIGYATAGALRDPDLAPAGVLTFLVGVLVAHDLIVMPALILVGTAITRLVPRQRRPAAVVAMVCAAAIIFVALPVLLGPGPPAYGRNLLVVLLLLAAVALPRWRWPGSRKDSERRRDTAAGPGDG